jgi:hypothetical protein
VDGLKRRQRRTGRYGPPPPAGGASSTHFALRFVLASDALADRRFRSHGCQDRSPIALPWSLDQPSVRLIRNGGEFDSHTVGGDSALIVRGSHAPVHQEARATNRTCDAVVSKHMVDGSRTGFFPLFLSGWRLFPNHVIL